MKPPLRARWPAPPPGVDVEAPEKQRLCWEADCHQLAPSVHPSPTDRPVLHRQPARGTTESSEPYLLAFSSGQALEIAEGLLHKRGEPNSVSSQGRGTGMGHGTRSTLCFAPALLAVPLTSTAWAGFVLAGAQVPLPGFPLRAALGESRRVKFRVPGWHILNASQK